MKNNIIFEVPKDKDCEEIAKLKLTVWTSTYSHIYPKEKFENFDIKKQTEKFKKYICDRGGLFIIARDISVNKIVGYCYSGHSERNFQKGTPEIMLLYILKEYQHRGIGRGFFERSKQFFESGGYDSFIISCNKYNYPAQTFYEKMGGKIIHIDDDNVDKSLPQIKYFYSME